MVLRDQVSDTFMFSQTYADLRDVCYAQTPPTGRGALMASTISSDRIDLKAWIAAKKPSDKRPFSYPRIMNPNRINLCAWYYIQCSNDNWPTVDQERIEKAMSPALISQLLSGRTAVDGILQTFGTLLLHEVRFDFPF